MGVRDRFLQFIADQAVRHPVRVLLFVLLVTGVASYFASQVKLNLSMLAELPDNDPMVKQFREAYDNYGGLEYVFVVLEADDIDRAKALADELAPDLKKLNKYFKSVRHKIDVDFFRPYSLLFLDFDEIDDLTRTFQRNITTYRHMLSHLNFDVFMNDLFKIFDNELSGVESIEEDDPRAAGIKRLRKWAEKVRDVLLKGKKISPDQYRNLLGGIFAARSQSSEIADEYFISPNERLLTIMLSPIEPSENIKFSVSAIKALEKVIKQHTEKFPDVKFGITGAMAIVRDEHLAIQRDMKVTTAVSMVGVLLLFALAYGKIIYAVLMAIPLIIGLLWTFGLVSFYPGEITLTTSVFGSILIGLGIDFAIHLMSRFNDEMLDGNDVSQSVIRSVVLTGRGIITGAVTTSAAFFTLLIAYHKGVEYMGWVAGCGIILCMLAMFLVVPPILIILGRKGILGRGSELVPLVWLAKRIEKNPWMFIIPLTLFSAWMLWEADHVNFDSNFRNLMPMDMPSLKWVVKFEDEFERGIDYGLVVADTLEEARRETEAMKGLTTTAFVDSIVNYIPENQEGKIKALKPLAKLVSPLKPADPKTAKFENANWRDRWIMGFEKVKTLSRTLKELSVVGGYFEGEDDATKMRKCIEEILSALKNGSVNEENAKYLNSLHAREFVKAFYDFKRATRPPLLGIDDLPEHLRKPYVGKDGRFLIYAYPSQSVWVSKPFMGAFVRDIKSVNPDAFGIPAIFYYASNKILEDLKNSALLALGVIFFLVLFDFKKLKHTVLVLLPLLMGVVWMVGSMPMLGVMFNFINVGTVSLVLGIGIDDGVHMMHRFMEEKSVVKTVARTGRAITLTSLTTMIGFGALLLAHFRGLNSMGEVLLMGVGYCLLTSVIGLGSILGILERRGKT